jgi:hypothetical protein
MHNDENRISFYNHPFDDEKFYDTQNCDEFIKELKIDLDLENNGMFNNQNLDGITPELRTYFEFDISGLFKKIRAKFDVTKTLNYNSLEEINKRFKAMKLNEKIKEKLYLDEDKTTKEIDTTWTEIINTKKRRRKKRTEKNYLEKNEMDKFGETRYNKIEKDKKPKIKLLLGRKRKR